MTNIEKGKLLKKIRKGLGLNQAEMARAIGLDPSYLSQFENGHRDIDDYYVGKAREIEKSKAVNDRSRAESGTRYSDDAIQERCHKYLAAVLKACRGDEDRLRWTYVELKRHFPINSTSRSDSESLLDEAEDSDDHGPKSK